MFNSKKIALIMINSDWKSYWLVFWHLVGSIMGQVQWHYT